jgi:sigma-54 interacting transcriptional regulator
VTPTPFAPDELERVSQVAAQIAIALENATAFDEIGALKEQLARENVYLKEEIRGGQQFEEIVGESKTLQQVLNQVRTVAETDTTVLLLGETGTGKELLARALHAASDRRAARSSPSTARPHRQRCSKANGSATNEAPSPVRWPRRSDGSSLRTRARCSSTRSGTCRSIFGQSCCASCRNTRSNAWAARGRSVWTSG